MKSLLVSILFFVYIPTILAGELYSFIEFGGTYSRLNLENDFSSEAEIVSGFDSAHTLKFAYHGSSVITELSYQQFNLKINTPDNLTLDDESGINSNLNLHFYLKNKIQFHFGLERLQRAIIQQFNSTLTNTTMDINALSAGLFIEGNASGVGKIKLGVAGKLNFSATEEIKSYQAINASLGLYVPYNKVILGLETILGSEAISLDDHKQNSFRTNIQFILGY